MSKQALASEQVGLGLKATLVGPGQLWGTPLILLARDLWVSGEAALE